MEIGALRDAFDVTDEVAYLNTAGMSPLLHAVRAAGERGLASRAAPWAITSADWFDDVERLRAAAARLVGASPEGIALVPATSYGLATAAANLRAGPGQRVLVLGGEFPSSYYTWQRFAAQTGAELVPVTRAGHPGDRPGHPDDQSWAEAVLAALDERTAVVVVPHVHWTNGALVDLEQVAAATHRYGAALVVDASQSLGAMPLDVARLRPDFLVAVGYKWLLGPFGLGYLYVADQHRDGQPLEDNWISREGSDDFAKDYHPGYRPGARRFDVGERTKFELVPMAIAAVEQLLDWGVPTVARTLGEVTGHIAERVSALGLPIQPAAARGPHLLGLDLPAGASEALDAALDKHGVVASHRGTRLRISPHLHTSTQDIDRLTAALREL